MLLDNIRVVELGRAVAAPWCGQTLGDFGAEVIKVEAVDGGDFTRQLGPTMVPDGEGRPTDTGSVFVGLNRNKKSIGLDLRQPEAQEIVKRLAATSDVLIENFKPGDLARRGLDYATIGPLNPRLIYLSISGFGQTGPYRQRPALDNVVQGLIGLMRMSWTPDGGSIKTPMPMIDYFTGMNGVAAVLAALYARDARGGAGQYIDLALYDAGLSLMSYRMIDHLLAGTEWTGEDQSDGISPTGLFETADGVFQMAIRSDVEFQRLSKALNRPDFAEDPRFATQRARTANRAEVTGAVAAEIRKLTTADALARLAEADILASPLNTLHEAAVHPQTVAREMIIETRHGGGAVLPGLANPIRFSGTPIDRYEAAPLLGSHTDYVLRELLDLDAAQVADLRARRVVA